MTERADCRTSESELPQVALSFDVPGVRQLRWLQVGLCGSVLLAGGLGLWWWNTSEQILATASHIEEATARVANANQRLAQEMARQGLSLTSTRIAQVNQELEFAKMLAARRGVSWTKLLTDLEQGVPKTVALRAVEMNHVDSVVTIEGTAKDLQDVNLLVTRLEAHSNFHAVRLNNHQVDVAQGGMLRKGGEQVSDPSRTGESKGRRIVFRLSAMYRQPL